MEKTKNPPSISDVAAAAKVSVTTVSRVLNNKEGVADDVRTRVQKAALSLAYRPLRVHKNSAANIQQANKPIAYLTRGGKGQGLSQWGAAFAAASQRLQRGNRTLNLQFIDPVVADAPESPRITRADLNNFAGILAATGGFQNWINAALDCGIPAVRFGYYPLKLPIPQVVGDSFAGSLKIMEHLLARGHKRIAIWSAKTYQHPLVQGQAMNEREKYAAYRHALDEAGIEFKEDWRIVTGFEWAQLLPAIKKLLAVDPAPTALYLDNDYITGAIFRHVVKSDELPSGWLQQFELAHFIDTGTEPGVYGITCAVLPMDRMGEIAADTILDLVNGQRYKDDSIIKISPVFLPPDKIPPAPGRLG